MYSPYRVNFVYDVDYTFIFLEVQMDKLKIMSTVLTTQVNTSNFDTQINNKQYFYILQ